MFKTLFGHFVSCRKVSHLVAEMQDRELSAVERRRLKWHLAICDACLAFEKQMRILTEAMRRYRQ